MKSILSALVCSVVFAPIAALAGEAGHGAPTHVAEATAVPPQAGELGGTLLVVLLGAGITIWLVALVRERLSSVE